MKTRISWWWTLGLLLAALPLASGCAQSKASADTVPAAVTNTAVPETAVVPAPNGTNVPPPAELAAEIAQAPAKPITTEPLFPARLQANRPVLDVMKLANSGLDEGVMMAYVTNSANVFNLGAEDIIYLKDIGVPDAVIKAMIYRDTDLMAQGGNSGPGMADPTYRWAQAPDTNGPPQAAPDPSQVAPQYEGTAPPQPAPTPPANVTYSTFQESLSPYGNWIEIEGYGRVWQPTTAVVNPAWRPYFDGGRWVYTDQGWYWLSDYSWGWAPFHYGRWFCHGSYGWCWAPDLVWGPSWVTWRYNSAYCGWAPLPPAACYYPSYGFYYYGCSVGIGFSWGLGYNSWCFVGYGHVQHHGLHAYRVPDHQAQTIYNSTTPVNRIVNQNNVVINRGIPPENIAAVTRQEVRRVPIRDRSTLGNGKLERMNPASGTLEVYRPAATVRADDPGIVQRSRREMPRAGSSERAASAPSAPLAERSGMARPAVNASASGTRGNSLPDATAPLTRSQPGRGIAGASTFAEQPAKPAVERSQPAAPSAPASASNPTVGSRQGSATVQGEKPRANQPIVLRGPQSPETQNVPRMPAPAAQPAPTINRPARPVPASGPEMVNSQLSTPRPNSTATPTAPLPRVETRPQAAPPAATWARIETPKPAAPTPAPQQRWNTPAPGSAVPRVERPQPAPRIDSPAVPRPSAPAYVPPPPAPRAPAPAPAYQPPARPVEVPRAAPMPAPAPQPAYRPPAPAPSAPPMQAPPPPAPRPQSNPGGGNPRGTR